MSGHSKWSTIKRKKGAADAKKGKIFTKLVREITTAARMGGGEIGANPRLRAAVAVAKAASMPTDNIERAIKKGTGELEGPPVEEINYEGFAPSGVALIIESQTDNRNRTTAEVRSVLTKAGGHLGATGSVAWMFRKRGEITFDGTRYSEDTLMEPAIEAGADDVQTEQDTVTVYVDPRAFGQVLDYFDKAKLSYESAEMTMVADNAVKVSGEEAEKLLRLVERLEDLDDVQKVHANFDIDEAELERLA